MAAMNASDLESQDGGNEETYSKSRPALSRNISSATTKPDRSIIDTEDGKPRFGAYSHGSSRNSLAGPQAEDQLPEWKL